MTPMACSPTWRFISLTHSVNTNNKGDGRNAEIDSDQSDDSDNKNDNDKMKMKRTEIAGSPMKGDGRHVGIHADQSDQFEKGKPIILGDEFAGLRSVANGGPRRTRRAGENCNNRNHSI